MAGTVLLTVSAFFVLSVVACRKTRVPIATPPLPVSAAPSSNRKPTLSASLPAPQVKATRLQWSIPPGNTHDTVTEVWATTNLSLWTLKIEVTGTNSVTIPQNGPMEFYQTRSRFTFTLTNQAGHLH